MNTSHIVTGEILHEHVVREIKQLEMRYTAEYPGLYRCEPSLMVEEMTRRMVASIRLKVAAKKYEVKTVRFPATWWDAFRLRFFPAKWLKRWPVTFEEVSLEAWAYHPDIHISNHQTYVEIAVAAESNKYRP
jgi:hypothetical protein